MCPIGETTLELFPLYWLRSSNLILLELDFVIALPHSQTLVVELDTTFVLGLQVKAVIIPYLILQSRTGKKPLCFISY